jgi:hypothetical protein
LELSRRLLPFLFAERVGTRRLAVVIVLNAAQQMIDFKLPIPSEFLRWNMLRDTTHPSGMQRRAPDWVLHALPRSVLVFVGVR